MKIIGLKSVPISKLKLPGNWTKILRDPEVQARAASIKQVGLIHEPVVRKSDMLLIAGRRRVAAHLRNGDKSVMIKLIECTDHEAAIIEQAENAERTHDSDKQGSAQARLVELLAKEISEREGVRLKGPGRGRTAKGRARELVAASRGVSPNAVRQAEYRERKRAESRGQPAAKAPKVPAAAPLIRTFGIHLEAEFVRDLKELQDLNEACERAATAALQAVKQLRKRYAEPADGLPPFAFPETYDKALDLLSQASSEIRGLRPVSVCPSCKAVDEISEECGHCRRLQYITRRQEPLVPAHLLDERNPVVVHKGQEKPLSEFNVLMVDDELAGLFG